MSPKEGIAFLDCLVFLFYVALACSARTASASAKTHNRNGPPKRLPNIFPSLDGIYRK